MERFFLAYISARTKRAWQALTYGQGITIGLFLLVVLAFGTGLTYLLVRGLRAVAADPFLGVALPGYLYQVFLLVTIGLVVVSTMLSGLYTFFRQPTDLWLMVSPKFRWLLWVKAWQVLSLSLWPVLVLTVPLMVAVQQVFSVGVVGFFLGLSLVSVLAVVASLSSLSVLLLVSWGVMVFWPELRRRLLVVLLVLSMGLLGAVGYVWWPLQSVSISDLFEARNLTITTAPTESVVGVFAHVPSYGAARGVLALQQGDTVATLHYVLLYSLALLLSVLAYSRFAAIILPLWQFYSASVVRADTDTLTPVAARRTASLTFGDQGQVRALLLKEVILLWRSGRELIWLGFLMVLWLVVTSFDWLLAQLVARHSTTGLVSEVVLALQLLVIAYFTAAIVLRFVFPAFSTERDSAWRVFVAPVDRTRWFVAKGGLFAAGMVLLTLCVVVIHLMLLPTGLVAASWFIGLALTQCLAVTGIGYGLGAAFPSQVTTDPQRLSTSIPGLSFTFIAIVCGALSGLVYYTWLIGGPWWWLVGYGVTALLLAAGVVRYGHRRFEAQEFLVTQQS